METVEVWPELQLIGVGSDAVDDEKISGSNVTVPLALSPVGQVSVTLAGLPLANALPVRAGTAMAVTNMAANPKRKILFIAARIGAPLSV